MCRHLNTVAGAMKVERVKYNGRASRVSISIQFMTILSKSNGMRIHRRRHSVLLSVCRLYVHNLGPSEITIGCAQLRLKWILARERRWKVNTRVRCAARVSACSRAVHVNLHDILAIRIRHTRLCEFARDILYDVFSLQNSVKRAHFLLFVFEEANFFHIYYAYNFIAICKYA